MNRVAKNAIWIIGGKIAQSVLALLINMLTARYLGPSNFGLITYAASLVAFAAPVMQLGFGDILVHELVNTPESEGKILGTSITLSIISAFACIIGVTSFAFFVNANETDTIVVCLLYSISLIFQALEHIVYWYQSKLMSKYISIISLVSYFLVSAYKIYLLVTGKNVYWFALSNSVDFALISFAGIFVYRKLGGQKLSFSLNVGKKMYDRSKHYILSSMLVTVFVQTDKIMIKIMLGEEFTGYYGASVTCAGMAMFIFAAIIDSFRPSIFEGQKISEDIFKHRITMLYSVIIYLSLAQSLIMTVFSGLVVYILYGAAYMPAANALKIVVWYTTFSYMGSVRNIWILAKNLQKYLWQINIFGAAANVVLNLALIPLLGINGAALASLVTQFFTNVAVGYIIKPIRPNNAIIFESLKPKYIMELVKKMKPKKTGN